ncbi:putative secreted protein [Bradyrhizobium elkanii]
MTGHRARLLCIASLLTIALGTPAAPAAEAYDPWPGLVQDIFSNRPMNDGNDVIGIEMPMRAEDAAIVPVTLRTKLQPSDSRRVVAITLVIDENPAPMAAKFTLGPAANVTEISTRVRVNNYTNVHAVAELSDGKLYVSKVYVKASARLLGAGRQKRRGSQEPPRPDALPGIHQVRTGTCDQHAASPDHDRASE